MADKEKRMNIYLGDKMREAVEKEAERQRRSMSQIVQFALEEYLKRK